MDIIKFGDNNSEVNPILSKLKDLGYYKGDLDGIYGRGAEAAIRQLQAENFVNGRMDARTYELLQNLHTEFEAKQNKVLKSPIIKDYPLRPNEREFVAQKVEKTQLFLHLTAGWPNAYITIQGWENDALQAMATAYVISGQDNPNRLGWHCNDGEIFRAFNDEFWAYHTGMGEAIDKRSIGVEICNWAYLNRINGKFFSYVNAEVPASQVEEINFRGFRFWQKITPKQITSIKELILWICERHPKIAEGVRNQTFDSRWSDYNQAVLNGQPGIWTHTSVVPVNYAHFRRFDMPPFPAILKMLNEVKNELK